MLDLLKLPKIAKYCLRFCYAVQHHTSEHKVDLNRTTLMEITQCYGAILYHFTLTPKRHRAFGGKKPYPSPQYMYSVCQSILVHTHIHTRHYGSNAFRNLLNFQISSFKMTISNPTRAQLHTAGSPPPLKMASEKGVSFFHRFECSREPSSSCVNLKHK